MGKTFKRGRMWGITFTDPQGRQVRKMISPYRETAEKILRKIQTEMVEGRYLDRFEKTAQVSFADFAERYLTAYVRLENKTVWKQSTKVQYIAKFFKNRYMDEITTLEIRQYIAKRLEKVKPSSANRDLSTLKCMFNRAIEWGIVKSNPTAGIKKLPENNERCRWLNEEEQGRLLSFCGGLTRTIVLIALRTGMRWGEIACLKWRQAPESNYVDLERNIVFIHQSLAKSKKSRWIPLSQIVKQELLQVPRQEGTDYIFLNPKTDKPLGSIKKAFNNAVKKAGFKDFKFHDLRHTFASQLVRSGVDLYVAQKLLGHSTPKMTQRYAHLCEDMLKDAIEKSDGKMNEVMYNHFSAVEKNSTFSAHSSILQDCRRGLVAVSN